MNYFYKKMFYKNKDFGAFAFVKVAASLYFPNKASVLSDCKPLLHLF